MHRTVWIWLLAAALAPAQQVERHVVIQRDGNVMFDNRVSAPVPAPMGMIGFMSSEMMGPPVKGAPYSAKAVTETNQTLADGNRIHRTVTGTLYRDSEGRTRREQAFGGLGPLAPAETMQMVTINDPVEGVTYMLDAQRRSAHKTAMPKGLPATVKALGPAPGVGAMMLQPHMGTSGQDVVMYRKRVEGAPGAKLPFKSEDLGTQVIEGVQATGTRTVMTIAAGEIGNERPIEVVSERWFSPELQVVVMTKDSDPRMGETIYRLTNISRSEPPHAMFEVPADYTVDEPMK